MQVTIVLHSGGFLIDDGQPHLDVGYFETGGAFDIQVFEGGSQVQPPPNIKLGGDRIEVQHLEDDGTTVKTGVNQSEPFTQKILKKNDLYAEADCPDFIVAEYDCILRFHSGNFGSSDVGPRVFSQHRVSDDVHTGNSNTTTRDIANEVRVTYDLAKGEILRLGRHGGTDLVWSSSPAEDGSPNVEVRILADESTNSGYFKRALDHKASHYFLPNSNPPPMNGNGFA
jgi:hypothetical protein